MEPAYAIGLDYGTSSVRAVVVDCADGRSVGTHVFDYPSGEQGILLDAKDPHLARQNPADYVEGLRASVKGALNVCAAAVELGKELRKDNPAFAGLKIYHCPMAPKPGLWFQAKGPLHNPYYGAEMLSCGSRSGW